MSKRNWTERARELDFDPICSAQHRVWARVAPAAGNVRRSRPLLWAACAAFILAAGGLVVTHMPFGLPFSADVLSEEDCAELNSRYLLAKALAASGDNCPCEQHLSSYDRRTMLHLRKELESVACTVCSAKEQQLLKQCKMKYPSQIKELKLCKTLC